MEEKFPLLVIKAHCEELQDNGQYMSLTAINTEARTLPADLLSRNYNVNLMGVSHCSLSDGNGLLANIVLVRNSVNIWVLAGKVEVVRKQQFSTFDLLS